MRQYRHRQPSFRNNRTASCDDSTKLLALKSLCVGLIFFVLLFEFETQFPDRKFIKENYVKHESNACGIAAAECLDVTHS